MATVWWMQSHCTSLHNKTLAFDWDRPSTETWPTIQYVLHCGSVGSRSASGRMPIYLTEDFITQMRSHSHCHISNCILGQQQLSSSTTMMTLFSRLLSFDQHVLHRILPARSDHDYNLRPWPWPHNLCLSFPAPWTTVILYTDLLLKTPITGNTQDPASFTSLKYCLNPTPSYFSLVSCCYWTLIFQLTLHVDLLSNCSNSRI